MKDSDQVISSTTLENKTITTPDFSKEILILREYTCLPFTEVKDTEGFIRAELVTLEPLENMLFLAFISDDKDNHPGKAVKNCIQKSKVTEQPADGKEFSYTIPQINIRRTSSSEPKKNGDLIDELEKQLTDMPKLRNSIYAHKLAECREDFKELKQYINNFIISTQSEQLAELNNLSLEIKSYVQKSLASLLFFSSAGNDQKLQAQQQLKPFLDLMEGLYLNLSILKIVPQGNLVKLIRFLNTPIFNLYRASKIARKTLAIKSPCYDDYDFNLFLLSQHCKTPTQYHFLSLNDQEILLLFLLEIIQKASRPDQDKQLARIQCLAVLLYGRYQNAAAALLHYDVGEEQIFELFHHELITKTPNPGMLHVFVGLTLNIFKCALSDKTSTPEKILQRSKNMILFLTKYCHYLRSHEPQFRTKHKSRYYTTLLVKDTVMELNKFSEGFQSLVLLCESDFKQQAKPKKNPKSPKKSTASDRRMSEAKEYQLYEKPALPSIPASTMFSALNPPPPMPTLRVSDEEKARKKMLRKKAYKKKKAQQNKIASGISSNSAPVEEKVKSYLIKNPLNNLMIEARIKFSEKFSKELAEYLVGILEKGKIGLRYGQIKPVNSTESEGLNNPKICLKLKGKFQGQDIRYYGTWEKDSKQNAFVLFHIPNFEPHAGAKSKDFSSKKTETLHDFTLV